MKEVRQVNITLKLPTTKTAMFDFVKENINIRVKGFGDVKEVSPLQSQKLLFWLSVVSM